MIIKRIERIDLQERIILEIKKHIYENQLQPGDLLPSQANMARQIGASRPSVREAIKTMEAQGLLRSVNGKGIYVEIVDVSFYNGGMNKSYLLKVYLDAHQVRQSLEGMAVELCTRTATDGQLRELSDILANVEDKYRKNERQSELDLLFHQTLIALSGNRLLAHLIKNLLQQSSGFWRMEDEIGQILTESIPSHRVMMDYMLQRDCKMALKVHNQYMNEITEKLEAVNRALQ